MSNNGLVDSKWVAFTAKFEAAEEEFVQGRGRVQGSVVSR